MRGNLQSLQPVSPGYPDSGWPVSPSSVSLRPWLIQWNLSSLPTRKLLFGTWWDFSRRSKIYLCNHKEVLVFLPLTINRLPRMQTRHIMKPVYYVGLSHCYNIHSIRLVHTGLQTNSRTCFASRFIRCQAKHMWQLFTLAKNSSNATMWHNISCPIKVSEPRHVQQHNAKTWIKDRRLSFPLLLPSASLLTYK